MCQESTLLVLAVFGFLQITFAAMLGYLVGLFYNNTLAPTAIGVTVAILLSATGYLIFRNAHDPDGALAENVSRLTQFAPVTPIQKWSVVPWTRLSSGPAWIGIRPRPNWSGAILRAG